MKEELCGSNGYLPIEDMMKEWLEAKEQERIATEKRRDIEDELLKNYLNFELTQEGVKTYEIDKFVLKITGRMNRKVDAEKLQEIAAEHGLNEYLASLFRWKPEINATVWKAADASITKPLLAAITTTPGKPSFAITIKGA
jgi:hypothetical protein